MYRLLGMIYVHSHYTRGEDVMVPDNAEPNPSSSIEMDVEEIYAADDLMHPSIFSREKENPFTYLASLSAKQIAIVDNSSVIRGKIKVVQNGIGFSPQEVSSALASSDSKQVKDMKETLKQFQIFLVNFEIRCSVSIKSLFDSMKIVAKGPRGMDPNTEVGRQTLEPNWCEIQVLVILESEESLIRSYDFLQRFGDVLGGMIAWPCHLLTVNEDFY